MEFKIPKKHRVKQKDAVDRRQFIILPIRAASDKRLTASQWRILAALCSFIHKNGVTWVSLTTIGRMVNVSEQRASVVMRKLKQYGYFEVIGKRRPGIRGDIRRVIFDANLSAEDAISISGESVPNLDDPMIWVPDDSDENATAPQN